MSPKTTLLLVASLVGTVVADQTQEVYKKDDSTFIGGAPSKFRDASDFTTPSSDPIYATIDGLPSHQHGFQLVNPRYLSQQSSSQVSASQKEEIRKQEEFVKSILDANKAAIDPKKSPTNIFRPSQPLSSSLFENGAFKSDSSHDTRFGTLDLFGTGVPEDSAFLNTDAAETTTHSVFEFHFPREQKASPSHGDFLLDSRDFVGDTSSKPAQRNDYSRLQSDSSSNSNGERKQSFVSRERGTTPAFQQVSGSDSAAHDFGRFGQASFSSERPAFAKINSNQGRNPIIGVGKPNRNGAIRMITATATSRPSLAEPTLVSGSSIPREDKFGTRQRPGRIEHQSSAIPGTTRFGFGAQSSDDEESKFISQLNQKTASFVSKNAHVNGFEESVPTGFESLHTLPGQTADLGFRQPPQDSPPVFGFAASQTTNKRRKEPIQRSRRPVQNQASSGERIPMLPPIPENRFAAPSSFQNSNPKSGEFDKQAVDQELEARKQAEGAMYSFASDVSDTVNDNSQSRQEIRDGLKLKGMYSYSDGFFKRTVHYEADEGGYRVVKEENEPIGAGPQYDPNGEVQVNFQQGGSNLQYKIRGEQLRKATKKGNVVSAVQTFDDYTDQQELPSLNY